MIIDYFDVDTYSDIRGGMQDREIDSRDVINVESKKKYFRVWFRRKE
jgi:hypothetical protein